MYGICYKKVDLRGQCSARWPHWLIWRLATLSSSLYLPMGTKSVVLKLSTSSPVLSNLSPLPFSSDREAFSKLRRSEMREFLLFQLHLPVWVSSPYLLAYAMPKSTYSLLTFHTFAAQFPMIGPYILIFTGYI